MHEQSLPTALAPSHHPLDVPLRLLALVLSGVVALHAPNNALAQNLDSEPLFGSTSLETGFASTPYTFEVSPGGEDQLSGLGSDCYGYVRFAQPDFVLNYQAGEATLGMFALSDLDITMAINDPEGNWYCNDDSPYLSGTNSGIQFGTPLSGDYQIWVGSYDISTESRATMLAITEADESEWTDLPIGLEGAIYAASFDLNGDIIYGDDSSGFANDGECDDPRFQGPGAAFGSSSEHLFKDATDCRTQLEASMINLADPEDMNLGGDMGTDLFGGSTPTTTAIDMPDAGPFGEVMSALMQAFQAIPGDRAGAMELPFGLGLDAASDYNRADMTELTGIDFGDNSGLFADDGECDDPRFEGPGAAAFAIDDAAFIDADDCSSLYLEGLLTYIDPDSVSTAVAVDSAGIDFGDNSSAWANDGECDDPRFEGPGAAASMSEDDELRDANDCRDMFESGRVTLVMSASSSPSLSSATTPNTQANRSADAAQETYTIGTPRGDINGATRGDRSIFASGTVYGDPINSSDRNGIPNYTSAPTRTALVTAIDFGDNSSDWANDNECDDPRFEGDGMAFTSVDEDRGRDANDCREAYEAGTITLIGNQEL